MKRKRFKYLIEEKLNRKLEQVEKMGIIFGNTIIPLLIYNKKTGKYKVVLRDIHYKFVNEWKEELEKIRNENSHTEKQNGWISDIDQYMRKLIYIYDILYFADENMRIDTEEKLKEVIENYEDLEWFSKHFGYEIV